jgi:bacterial/archaeal transporter family protein
MNWFTIAVLTALSYGLYNFFIKLSSSHIHQLVGAVILQAVAMLFGLLALVLLKIKGTDTPVSYLGVKYAILAGVFVGLAEILSFYFFSLNVSAARGIPIIIGGSVAFGAALGILLLKEQLDLGAWFGISLIVIGVVLLTLRGEGRIEMGL